MHPSLRASLRRAAWGLGGVALLGATFVLGVVAGAGSATPTPEPTGVLDEAAGRIAADGLHPVARDVLDAAAIKAMLAAADDQWGSWGDGSTSSGRYAGVGLWLREHDGVLEVSQLAAGGPAERGGVRVGDGLLEIDGRATAGLDATDAAAALRGEVGSTVTLLVAREDARRTLSLRRAAVVGAGVTADMVSSSVGRIVVPAFTQGTGRQVRDSLRALKGQQATGVVLDLRGNPGGLLAEAVETASAFLTDGEVVTYARRDEAPQHLDVVGPGDGTLPVVVLVDGSTASAAEVVAGALPDRGRAVVVGARTFGKGTVQEPQRLPDGSSLALTVARYTLPSGRSVEGVGIEPDIQVFDNRAAMPRAIEVLVGLIADTGSGRG
jgi:carboxyl-terminal processing protease